MRRRHIFFAPVVLAILCLCIAPRATRAQGITPPLPKPVPFRWVTDNAGVIDPATKNRLEAILNNLKERANIEFAVVTVRTTGDQDIFDYTLALARGWGIGSKEGEQAGMILLVAVDDHKYFTQVSRHLEGDLPDSTLGQIQRERLVPQFKQGNYSQGISDTVETYIATLSQKRNFSIAGIDQSHAYREQTRHTDGNPPQSLSPSCCTGLIILFVIIFILSNRGRRGGGGGGSGCLNLLLLNALFNSGRGGSSGWSGGGFGGSSGGGGGGGFGGFGGGGDFGGGGSGGSW